MNKLRQRKKNGEKTWLRIFRKALKDFGQKSRAERIASAAVEKRRNDRKLRRGRKISA